MAKILVLGVGKSGTTILFQILKNSLPPDTVCLFEPPACQPAEPSRPDGSVLAKVLLESPLGDAHYAPEVCAAYDKRLYIHRDPRDVLVELVPVRRVPLVDHHGLLQVRPFRGRRLRAEKSGRGASPFSRPSWRSRPGSRGPASPRC